MTEPVKNFVCWHQSAVTSVSAVDVHSLSDWLFNAVHHPLRPQRRKLRSGGGSSGLQWVTEENVVEALKQDVGPDGYLLIPIFGNAGTGKTHLVKWVHTQCTNHANWYQLYMKKNRTSLRDVIVTLAGGLKGPIKAQTLEKLEAAPAQHQNDEALGGLLIDRIAQEVEFGDSRDSEITNQGEKELRQSVRRDLPALLRDRDIRPLLTGEGGVIPKLVYLSSGNRQPDDDYDPHEAREFRLEDLALRAASEAKDPRTRNTIKRWLGPGKYQSTAVALVNEVIESAIRQVFIASVNLSELFENLRRELHKQGKELVIYIEDLTVFKGVSEELLDALTNPPTPNDDEPMCKLRVIFAVTEGYLDARQTFKRRCKDAFSLDAQPDSEGLTMEDVFSLVGRYLNVTRVETEETGKRTRPVKTPENACGGCKNRGGPGREVCHASFGNSKEGYGLYPFNRTSLNHLVTHRLNDGTFDPSKTVQGLCDFLNEGFEQIPSAEFPSDRIPELLGDGADALDVLVRATMERRWPSEHERVEALVRYWSREAPQIDDGERLGLSDPGVLTAFGIDPEDIRVIEPEPGNPPTGETPPTPEKEAQWHDGLAPTHKELATKLDQWAAGTRLNATQTRSLRELVRKAITENLELGPTPLNHKSSELEKRFHNENHIGVTGSVTKMPADPVITIEADTDTAMAVQGLMRLRFLPDDRFDGADTTRSRAATKLEEWTDRVSAHLCESAPPEVEEPIQALVMAAVLNGNCEDCKTPADYAQAIFHGDLDTGKVEGRTRKWADLVPKVVKEPRTERTRLDTIRQMLGETRGASADVMVVDASRLVPVVGSFIAESELESTHPKIQQLVRQFEQAVEAEWKDLRKAESAVDLLHPADPLKLQIEKVIDTLETAAAGGYIEGGDISILEHVGKFNKNLADDTHPHRVISELAALDDADLTLLDKARWAASPRAVDVRGISALAIRIDQQFESIDNALKKTEADGDGDGNTPAIQTVVVSVMKALTALEQSLDKIRP